MTVAQISLRTEMSLVASLASQKRGGSAESMVIPCWESFPVCPTFLLPAEFLV